MLSNGGEIFSAFKIFSPCGLTSSAWQPAINNTHTITFTIRDYFSSDNACALSWLSSSTHNHINYTYHRDYSLDTSYTILNAAPLNFHSRSLIAVPYPAKHQQRQSSLRYKKKTIRQANCFIHCAMGLPSRDGFTVLFNHMQNYYKF